MDGTKVMVLDGAEPGKVSGPETGTETDVIAKHPREFMHKLKAEG